jgi:hypothetical protein
MTHQCHQDWRERVAEERWKQRKEKGEEIEVTLLCDGDFIVWPNQLFQHLAPLTTHLLSSDTA